MRRMAMALLLALVLLMGGIGGMNGNAQADWYREVLSDAQMQLGNSLRLKQVIRRAQAGERVTLAFIGGSITEGAGASSYQECYACRVFQGFRERYGEGDGKNVHCVNAGVGGTPSPFGLMRWQRDVVDRVDDDDGLPDLVVVEYAVNDYGEPTNHRCYESLVKSILAQENAPAVILLFSVFENGFTLQEDLSRIGSRYDLMMVSIKDGAYGHVGREWSKAAFFHDQYHPTSLGHGVMADCVLAAIEAANAAEDAEKDIDLSVSPAYGTDYMGLVTVYASDPHGDIALDAGGFSGDDPSSYRNLPVGRVCGQNFFHSASSGPEPLRFTAIFKNLLVAWRAVNDASYGAAEILVDGKTVKTLRGRADKWGQSEVVLAFSAAQSASHTVEIRMKEGDEGKKFTVTCLSYTP